jgi:hypothetical protein
MNRDEITARNQRIDQVLAANPKATDRQIAAIVGGSRTAVWKYRSQRLGQTRGAGKNSAAMTDEKEGLILAGLREGNTQAEIAAAAHCSQTTVFKIAKKHCLSWGKGKHVRRG